MKRTLLLTTALGLSTLGLATVSSSVIAHDHASSEKVQAVKINPQLAAAVASEFRSEKNAARDEYRNPAETLAFLGIQPDDTVIELWPGGGWYTEILAPYLAEKGKYIGGIFETNPKEDTKRTQYYAKSGKKFETWLSDNKEAVGNASTVTFQPPASVDLGIDKSADYVLTFRNLHNWAGQKQLENAFTASYKVLKDGGIFGVVEHRANPGMSFDSGYMDQAEMIALAEKVGFTLVAASEINANPKDTKDYAKGVWTLPPRLALEDQDKQKYLDIGESDRMTLKFVKKAK
ncbi:methyltransferase [Shewanella sp. 10N.7]|uniref:class I SAM-dependent methyltransferase n=1 Tax=Shewanella sp. 10N.7 TaxID=2885093 RepID=UPI001E2E7300|nr:methyltransferase [Shewanella sp. 10N.7]MCC4832904.1 methyltransferase [Shewanella sp. 10N.7]